MNKDLRTFLDEKINDHCIDHVKKTQNMDQSTESFKEQVKRCKYVMSVCIWRHSNIIECCYFMKITRQELHKFGLSDEVIDDLYKKTGWKGKYPY